MLKRLYNILNLFSSKFRYLFALYREDMNTYLHYSCMNTSSVEVLATNIRLLSHALEKGMSLENCRPGFGKQKIEELIMLCDKYKKLPNPEDPDAVRVAYGVLKSYIIMQEKMGVDLCYIPSNIKQEVLTENMNCGYLSMVYENKDTGFEKVAKHRHSLRYFANRPLKEEDLIKAFKLAQTAPSACNRQSPRVYAVLNGELVTKIMQLHGGIRSFSKPAAIFIVCGDLRSYINEYERNTVYVDGGIFTMNLLYALDSVGIASCPAIWGNIPSDDILLSKLVGIPSHHKIINLIVAGYYPSGEYKVAVSAKRNVNQVFNIIK